MRLHSRLNDERPPTRPLDQAIQQGFVFELLAGWAGENRRANEIPSLRPAASAAVVRLHEQVAIWEPRPRALAMKRQKCLDTANATLSAIVSKAAFVVEWAAFFRLQHREQATLGFE